MWFRIEVEHNLFAGISLFDMEDMPKDGNAQGYQVNEITADIIDEAAQYLNRDIITPADWWLTWCYPNGRRQDDYYDDVSDFKHMNQCAVNLVDTQKRAELVKNAVMVFEQQLLNYHSTLLPLSCPTKYSNNYFNNQTDNMMMNMNIILLKAIHKCTSRDI